MPVITTPTQSAPAPQTRITTLAFLDRFTDAEAIMIDLKSIGATIEAATIRRFLDKVKAATFIDLSRADTIAGVTALETIGLIAEGRAYVILNTPVVNHEVPS